MRGLNLSKETVPDTRSGIRRKKSVRKQKRQRMEVSEEERSWRDGVLKKKKKKKKKKKREKKCITSDSGRDVAHFVEIKLDGPESQAQY